MRESAYMSHAIQDDEYVLGKRIAAGMTTGNDFQVFQELMYQARWKCLFAGFLIGVSTLLFGLGLCAVLWANMHG